MLNLTLDHNCLIHLERNTGQCAALRDLLALHRAGRARVHIGAISASENVKGGAEPSYAESAALIERLGLGDLPHVLPEGRIDMSYVGHSVIADDDDLAERVQKLVHPSLHQVTIEKNRRNRFCDIDGMVAHIRAGHDVFVTEDRHFLNRRDALIALGAGDVLTPEAATKRIPSGP